jgi:uncharacterized membrane protein
MFDQFITDILAYGHVLSAMGWLGGGIIVTFVVGPNVSSLTPGAGLEFFAKILPKILRFFQVTVVSTLLFGVLLFLQVGNGMTTTQFDEIAVGVVIAIVTGIIAFAETIPSFRKVSKIANEAIQNKQPPSPDIAKYGRRARIGSLVGVLLLLCVLGMMIASGFS